jgi:hypothetical protein
VYMAEILSCIVVAFWEARAKIRHLSRARRLAERISYWSKYLANFSIQQNVFSLLAGN